MPLSDNNKQVAEVVVHGTIDSGGSDSIPVQNVFHYARTSTANPVSKTNLKNKLEGSITGTPLPMMRAFLNAAYTMDRVSIRWIDDPLDAFTDFTIAQPGTVTGDRLPSQVMAFVHLKTPLRGGSYRGSKKFAPLSESDIGDDVLTAATLTKFANWASVALTQTDSDGNVWNLVIVPRIPPNQLIEVPAVVNYEVVTQVLTRQTVGYLKSRKVRSIY